MALLFLLATFLAEGQVLHDDCLFVMVIKPRCSHKKYMLWGSNGYTYDILSRLSMSFFAPCNTFLELPKISELGTLGVQKIIQRDRERAAIPLFGWRV